MQGCLVHEGSAVTAGSKYVIRWVGGKRYAIARRREASVKQA